jgi:regulator of protease activity HflC (stomatin/prohibitin superfamily)
MKSLLILATLCTALSGCGFWPPYNVWSTKLDGEAELAKADSTRKIAVLEAQAKLDSASKLADAEIARARGVAGANQIIGDSLKGNDAYLRYLWITEVAGKDVEKTVVYIPTEANIPLGEAGRALQEPKAK